MLEQTTQAGLPELGYQRQQFDLLIPGTSLPVNRHYPLARAQDRGGVGATVRCGQGRGFARHDATGTCERAIGRKHHLARLYHPGSEPTRSRRDGWRRVNAGRLLARRTQARPRLYRVYSSIRPTLNPRRKGQCGGNRCSANVTAFQPASWARTSGCRSSRHPDRTAMLLRGNINRDRMYTPEDVAA